MTESSRHIKRRHRIMDQIAKRTNIDARVIDAMQTNLLKLQEGASVLEIGTGCGYQTAVLCELGYRVYSIERHEELYHIAQKNINSLGYSALLVYGDGFEGLPQYAPFDGVLIT